MDAAPLRRSSLILCILVLLGGILYLHHEVLLGGQIYHMDDAADGYYPSHVAITRAWKSGHLPSWERSAWCGFPLIADPYYGALYPLTAIFALLGPTRGLGFSIALHVFLGGLGLLLLLRRRGLSDGPALLGAVSLSFGTFMVERIRHVIFPEVLCWLPWVLLGAELSLAPAPTRPRLGLWITGGSFALLILCGGLPLLPFIALLLLAYLAPRTLLQQDQPLPLRLRSTALLALALVAGLLCGMAQVAPTLAHLPESPRSLGTDYDFASSYAWPSPRYVATLLLPNLLGRSAREEWFGPFNHWEMAGYYAGGLGVLLAPLGLLRRRPELWGLGLCGALSIALAFGDAGPLHRWFFYHVPLYGALRCPPRALVMFLLAVPILCAEGLQLLLSLSPRRWPLWLRVGLVALCGLSLWSYFAWQWGHLPPPGNAALRRIIRWDLRHLGVVLGAGLSILLGRLLFGLPARAAGAAIAACALLDLLLMSRIYIQPRPADFATGTERFAAVDWLLLQHPQDRFAPEASGPFRLLNLGLTYNQDSATGYDSYTVWRYVHLLYILNNGAVYPYPQLRHDPAAGTIKRWSSPLVDLLNVRWAIATGPPAPDWIERFRPQPGAPPHARYEPAWDPQLRVYENPHPLPRAFVVYQAQVLPDDRAQAQALLSLDPRKTAILDQAPDPTLAIAQVQPGQVSPNPTNALERPPTPARLVRAENDHLVIESDTAAPGILVLSEVSYPGWRATLDGKEVPLLRADYAFRGVAVPAGRHQVELQYHSRPVQLGLGLTGLGLLGLLLLGLVG